MADPKKAFEELQKKYQSSWNIGSSDPQETFERLKREYTASWAGIPTSGVALPERNAGYTLTAPSVSLPGVKNQGNLLSMNVGQEQKKRALIDEQIEALEEEKKLLNKEKDLWSNSQFKGPKWAEVDAQIQAIDRQIAQLDRSTWSQDVISQAENEQKNRADAYEYTAETRRLLNMDTQMAEAYAGQLEKIKESQKQFEREYNQFMDVDPARSQAAKRNYDAVTDLIGQMESKVKWEDIERAKDLQRQVQLNQVANQPGFSYMSGYKSTLTGQAPQESINKGGAIYKSTDGWGDLTYELVNKIPEAIDIERQNASVTGGKDVGSDKMYLLQMNDREVSIYNYYYRNDKKTADEYLELLKPELLERQANKYLANIQQMAKESPGAASVMSVGMGIASLPSAVGQVLDYLDDGKIEINSAYNNMPRAQKAIRETVGQQIEEKLGDKWGKVGSAGYQLGMSMADFLAAAGVSGGVGNLASVLLGGSAAAQTTIEAKQRGLSDGQAISLGVISGVAEWFTERFSVEKLLDVADMGKSAGSYILKNIIAEGGEEGASNLINLAADVLISKDKSQWKQTVGAYKNAGYEEKSAFMMAFNDQVMQLGADVLGGGISGGLMGGGNVAINNAAYAMSRPSGAYQQRQQAMDAIMQMAKQLEAPQQSAQQPGVQRPAQTEIPAQAQTRPIQAPVIQTPVGQVQHQDNLYTTAAEAGAKKQDVEIAERISKATGRKIVFYEADPSQNGYYADGVIHINTRAGDPLAQIISHEMTHSVELSGVYSKLSAIVLNRIQQTGGNLEQIRQEKIDLYKRNGVTLSDQRAVDAELVAEYVAKNLLTDENQILQMVQNDRSLAEKIRDWISGLLAKLGNEAAAERAFLTQARDLYSKALQQTTPATQQQETNGQMSGAEELNGAGSDILQKTLDMIQFSISDPNKQAAMIGNLRQYLNGGMSIQELNQKIGGRSAQGAVDAERSTLSTEAQKIKNAARRQQMSVEQYLRSNWELFDVDGEWNQAAREALDDERGARYSFAGERARTASEDDLNRAKQMQQDGNSREEIFRETGWFQGADGKWRFEIDDSGMQYYSRTEEGAVPGQTLADYLQHDELFKNYPQLRSASLEFAEMEKGVNGQYNRSTNTITLSEKLRDAPESLLIHEVQHAIQKIEGFASGATESYWQRRLDSGFDGKTQMQKNELKRLWQEYNEIRDNEPEFFEAMTDLDAMTPNVPRGKVNWDTLEKIEEDPIEWQQFDAARDKLEEEYGDLKVWDFMDLQHNIRQLEMNEGRSAADLYYNTAGEIEARDVARRRNLTAEERREKMPDVGNEDTVFAEDAGGSWLAKELNLAKPDVDFSEEEPAEVARQMMANGASAKEIFDSTGLIVLANGTITNPETGEIIGRYDQDGTKGNERVSDGVFANAVSGQGGQSGRNLDGDRTEQSKEPRRSWNNLSSNQRRRIKDEVGQHLDNVNSDMIIAFRGLGNLETAQRIYTDLIVDQVNAEQWGRYIPNIDSLIRKMEGIISKDNAFAEDKEIEIVQTRERLAELENILFDGNDFGFSADEINTLRNEYTKLNAAYDKMIRDERASAVKTPLKTVLENLQYYRRSDLESLAEQASDGAWDDYEDLTTEELIDGLREMIEGWELSPLEMQSARFGLFVKPPAHNQTGNVKYSFSEEANQIEDDHEMAFDALLRDVEREQETQATRPERLEDTRRSLESYMDMQDRMWAEEAKEEQAAAKISAQFNRRPTSLREDLREAKSYFIRKMVDAGEAVARIGKAVGDKGLYHYYNMARASSNAAINMITDKRTDTMGNVTGDGLDKVLKTVREKGNDYYKRFQLYLYHMHNIDRMSRENPDRVLMARAEFQEFTMTHPELSKYAEFQIEQMAANPNGELYIEAREYIAYRDAMRKAENTRNKPVFGFEVTAEDSRAIVQRLANEHPEFAQEAQKVYDYIDNLLRYRVDSGLITEEDYEMLKSIYPHYVPTYRSFEWDNQPQTKQKGKVQIGKTIQRASGGDAKLMPLHKALSQQTMSVVREGSKNRFGQRLMQDNENGQAYEHIYNVAEYDNNFSENTFDRPEDEEQKKTNTFVVRQDGKLWELTISPALYEAVQALSPERDEANAAVRIIRKGNDLFKKLVTGYNPTFLVRNLLRDLQDAGFYSADLSEFVKQYPQAIREMQKDGKYWQQYKALGGTYSSVFDYETGDTSKGGKLKQNTIGRIEALNQAIEQAPRLAEFMATVKKAEKDHGQATMDDLMEAMYNAADITVNFGRAGTLGKKLNANLVPFLNPGIQGFSKQVRSVTETKGLKDWARLAAKAALFGVAPMLLNALIYRDDDEWDDLKDRDKDVYYLFKIHDGLWLKLPKGRTLSLIGMTADRAVDAAQGEDVDWGSYIETVAQQSAPANPFENNIAAAAFNTHLFDPDNPGETWYGTDIESQRLQNYAPAERYDASTDIFSKWLGKVTKLSPAKINYLLDQYTGVAGDVILPLLSPQAERDMFSAAFTIDSNYSNRFSNEFYEMADELTYRKNMPDATGVDNILNRFWSKQSTAISEVNKAIRKIEADTELKNKDKKELTAAQYGIRNALMENALETLDAYTEAAEYYYNASTQADEEDRIDEAYRQANREIFGAEYAIKAYNKDVHETATEMLQNSGISFDAFYDFYFAQKDIEATGYEKTNEKRNLIMQSGLTDEQKEALYTKYVSDTRTDDIAAFRDAGMGMDTFMQIQNQYAAIENMKLSSSEKRTEFSRWLFKQPLNAQQDAVASEVFSFYSHISAQESKYEQLINAGVSDEDAYSISNALFALEPEEGKSDVSARQKYKAIADKKLKEADAMKAYGVVMSESEYKKLQAANDLALDPNVYAEVKYLMPEYDENGNGSYSNAEIEAAIKAYAKENHHVDNGDKALLWQMLTGSDSTKNNPFSKSLAKRYLEELSKLKGEE